MASLLLRRGRVIRVPVEYRRWLAELALAAETTDADGLGRAVTAVLGANRREPDDSAP
ncbi:MAG: hypothetical protein M3Y36_01275 [Actinomycetota bacterium]|nr:hypothetical protein [Actinomycetota bacterium]